MSSRTYKSEATFKNALLTIPCKKHKISTLFSWQFNGKSSPLSTISSLFKTSFISNLVMFSTSLGCILVLIVSSFSAIFVKEAGASAKNFKRGGVRYIDKRHLRQKKQLRIKVSIFLL